MDDEMPRELRDYEWDDDDDRRPPAWERRRRVARWVAIIAVFSLVVPGLIGTWVTARSTAIDACRIAVDFYASPSTGARVAFEVANASTLGWNCYAQLPRGDLRVAVLGIIPGMPELAPRS